MRREEILKIILDAGVVTVELKDLLKHIKKQREINKRGI